VGGWAQATCAVAAALGGGASFAAANVMQQRTARRLDADDRVRPSLLLVLIRHPLWLAGFAASGLGFGLQALALSLAPIVLVQPLIVTELIFALPLAAWASGVRLGRREWSGALLVAGGLAAFLAVAQPREGSDAPGQLVWIAVVGGVALAVAIVLVLAPRRRGIGRTSALGASAGLCFGLMSALTKSFTDLIHEHGPLAVAHWQPWVLVVVAICGLILGQSAFQAGPLAVSLPLIDVLEPLVAGTIAVVAFGEQVAHGMGAVAGLLVAGLAVVAGVVTLDRSPLVQQAQAGLPMRREPVGSGQSTSAVSYG
jgi:drug/metabolite transporter (DMT)-like permease